MSSAIVAKKQPQIHHIDGPMLPHLNHFSMEQKTIDDNTIPRATTSLAPILTPPIKSSSGGEDDDSLQYLIVPNPHRIVIRSAHHGKRVCSLTPPTAADAVSTTTIRAVSLAWLPCLQSTSSSKKESESKEDNDDDSSSTDDDMSEDGERGEWVILAACSDGSVIEWSLSNLSTSGKDSPGSSSSLSPRRSFKLSMSGIKKVKDLQLIHLTSPSNDEDTYTLISSQNNTAVLYGLARGKYGDSTSEWLVRLEISPFDDNNSSQSHHQSKLNEGCFQLPATPLAKAKHVSSKSITDEEKKNEHICLKRNDVIFGLVAAYRTKTNNTSANDGMDYALLDDVDAASANGNVFVTICSSQSIIIYRDTLRSGLGNSSNDSASSSVPLVHFRKSLKPTQSHFYTKEQAAFCSVAISPGTKNLALGRANGHIEVLSNMFENVETYLDGNSSSSEEEHPAEVTVRRTVHWHAHQVRTLAFLASSNSIGSGNNGNVVPASLLSGGEESVLVTWSLERNYHKPSNFVSRISHGSIVHISCCPYKGKVYVFCSDNSVGCYDGSNYNRAWMERGLASMALHQDQEELVAHLDDSNRQGHPKRGPVVMVNDPITDLPMLTNLPGAPGMVHWYDTNSASVVGTLEVAPYNRVSRRDASDPYIPAPSVTHMAVSKDGKDMVTVDTVWTENTSVGTTYEIPGTSGVCMNLCTSIKFWTYTGDDGTNPSMKTQQQQKRLSGEAPMNYELVSSMAAPHGRNGEVCALALAPQGNVACTLSKEEDAFRVWGKSTTTTAPGVATTMWKCLYRVKTPSGYSNLLSNGLNTSSSPLPGQTKLVAFSSDGTVLSVSYGPCVTLWDHSNAALLTSLNLDDANENGSEDIQSVDFLTKDDDAMLLTSKGRIGVKSPFGGMPRPCYLGEDEWTRKSTSFVGDEGNDTAIITSVIPLRSIGQKDGEANKDGTFAISTVCDGGLESVVSIVDRDGEGTSGGAMMQWKVSGEVQCLCVERCQGSSIRLLAMTKDCQILSLSHASAEGKEKKGRRVALNSNAALSRTAPVLKVGTDATYEQTSTKKRKVSIAGTSVRTKEEDGDAGFNFPALSGRFTAAFIARSLGKRSR